MRTGLPDLKKSYSVDLERLVVRKSAPSSQIEIEEIIGPKSACQGETIDLIIRINAPPFLNLDALAYKHVEVLGVTSLSDSIPDESALSFPRAQSLYSERLDHHEIHLSFE